MSVVMERPSVALESAPGRYIDNVSSVEHFVDRLMTIHHGERFGYYEALADCGPLTYVDLANHVGISQAKAHEWLEAQVALGVLQVDERVVPAWERRYRLPASRAAFLLNLEDPFFSQSELDAIAA